MPQKIVAESPIALKRSGRVQKKAASADPRSLQRNEPKYKQLFSQHEVNESKFIKRRRNLRTENPDSRDQENRNFATTYLTESGATLHIFEHFNAGVQTLTKHPTGQKPGVLNTTFKWKDHPHNYPKYYGPYQSDDHGVFDGHLPFNLERDMTVVDHQRVEYSLRLDFNSAVEETSRKSLPARGFYDLTDRMLCDMVTSFEKYQRGIIIIVDNIIFIAIRRQCLCGQCQRNPRLSSSTSLNESVMPQINAI